MKPFDPESAREKRNRELICMLCQLNKLKWMIMVEEYQINSLNAINGTETNVHASSI